MQDTLGALYQTAELQLVLCRGTRTVAPSGSFSCCSAKMGREGQDMPSPDHPKGNTQRDAAPHLCLGWDKRHNMTGLIRNPCFVKLRLNPP